jgi:thiamine-monophosphate kinase
MGDYRRLDELGERRIIEDILRPRYEHIQKSWFGNDCSLVPCEELDPSQLVVATTDPCPKPMASILGYNDMYYWGWLLATINLSDLAAVGAKPLGLLTSLILPNETTVEQFRRLLDGLDDCCKKCGTFVIGGNLKEGSRIDLTGTAIGLCNKYMCMSRKGCQEGNSIVIVGQFGLFWAEVLSNIKGLSLKDFEGNVHLQRILKPIPQVKMGQELAKRGLLTACLDNSDGLYTSLIQLANYNGVRMHVEVDNIQFPKSVVRTSSMLGLDPIRLALGWGDWNLVGCIDSSKRDELINLGRRFRVPVYIIGEVKSGRGVFIEYKGVTGEMAPIDSQRFTRDSWFTTGLQQYIDLLLRGSLWKNTH